MRLIGYIDTESQARVFRSYLLTLGMHADVEQARDNRWGIWVHEETRLDEGRAQLETFLQNPRDPRYQTGAEEGQHIEREIRKDNRRFKERHVDLRTAWHKTTIAGIPLTATLVFFAIATFVLQQLPQGGELIERWFRIMDLKKWVMGEPLLTEVFHGQVWRLITPIFLHFGLLHIIFNCMWLHTLGGDVERVEGPWVLGAMVLVFAIAGNVLQLYFASPAFGGMSGVNYGLFAYVWLVGKWRREPRYQLDPFTIGLMLFWFVACWLGWVGAIANYAHTGGLVMGAIWAAIKCRQYLLQRYLR